MKPNLNNRIKINLIQILILVIAFTGLSHVSKSSFAQDATNYVPNELLVKYRDPLNQHSKTTASTISKKTWKIANQVALLQLLPGQTMDKTTLELKNDPNVMYVEPNLVIRKTLVASDPRYLAGDQWALAKIQAEQAWENQTDASSIIIAILDTGIDYSHPDLIDNLWKNPNEINNDGIDNDNNNGIVDDYYGVNFKDPMVSGDPMDDDTADAHGTHVAGIAGAVGNNGIGVSGVSWKVNLMAVKFLHGPLGEGTLSDMLKGIDYALKHGANILNFSNAGDGYSNILKEALLDANNQGVIVVSAAGNEAIDIDRNPVSPGSIRTTNNITVASTNFNDQLSSFSNYGPISVDIAAPGGSTSVGILSTVTTTVNPSRYAYLAGTSMSTPFVSGLAALIWANSPNLTHHQVKARIFNNSDKLVSLDGKTLTSARINASLALTGIEQPAIFTVNPNPVSAGRNITVSGVNFGATRGVMTLDTIPLTIVSWNTIGTEIIASLPINATSGDLQVNGEGSTYNLTISRPSSTSDSRCFIATAAYGTVMHPKVISLRRFRDSFLLTNWAGKKFVEIYYKISPPLADLIRDNAFLKKTVAWGLTPMIEIAEYFLEKTDVTDVTTEDTTSSTLPTDQ